MNEKESDIGCCSKCYHRLIQKLTIVVYKGPADLARNSIKSV